MLKDSEKGLIILYCVFSDYSTKRAWSQFLFSYMVDFNSCPGAVFCEPPVGPETNVGCHQMAADGFAIYLHATLHVSANLRQQ